MNRIQRLLFEGWGRRCAWIALLLLLLLQATAQPFFEAPRLAIFDLYERVIPRNRNTAPVLIVAIDDASLNNVGQWPWPRQIVAKLVSRILEGKPAALGIDVIWPEPGAQPLGIGPTAIVSRPFSSDRIPSTSQDDILAQSIRAGPVVTGIAGLPTDDGRRDTAPLAPVRVFWSGGTQELLAADVPHYENSSRSIADLDSAAAGHGVLSASPDSDGYFRRLPLMQEISGRLAPSFDLEILRLAAKAQSYDIYFSDGLGIEGIGAGSLRIPTQSDGSVWINYSPHDERRFISAGAVLSGRVAPEVFDQKLVLLGVTGLGLVDQQQTPLGFMPGLEIQGQLLENVVEGKLARRPVGAHVFELALSFCAALLIIFLPALRPRWQPIVVISAIGILVLCGFGFWFLSRLLVDIATPMIVHISVVAVLIGGSFTEADVQRRRLRHELELRKLAAARAEGEMAAAHRIQHGMLPNPLDLAGDARFELDAFMIPARQIGGDLFDFFKIDADRLFFNIGDVSGKGIPAALFMALGKTICKNNALRGEADIGAIICRSNDEILRDNPESLFITLAAGILDIATGDLRLCNAGHDAPFLIRKGTAPSSIAIHSGPPLGVIEFSYQTERVQLLAGDIVCLITDGLTEAIDADGAILGRGRLENALAHMPPAVGVRDVTRCLKLAVENFLKDAPASDDLTVLVLHWHGPNAP